MRKFLLFIVSTLLLSLGSVASVSAQYIYIDVNGNGVSDAGDVLSTSTTSIDIWLRTTTNRDNSPAPCTDTGFIFSYEFILKATNGTITWGPYTDHSGFTVSAELISSPTEYHDGRGGFPFVLPADPFKVGSLALEVASGTPCLSFAAISGQSSILGTSFGSCCPGTRFDNTLRLGEDWVDADGTVGCLVPTPGALSGRVTANCPSPGTPLHGVTVDAFEQGSGDLAASAVTDPNGMYTIDPLDAGTYVATVLTPLGYSAATPEVTVTVPSGQTATADFALTCLDITSAPRTIGYWKHQVGVALGGNGNAQVDATTLCHYLDLIEGHFNNNALNPVAIYEPPSNATCTDKLETAKILLNLSGSAAMIDRAKQQLIALLLNVAAGYISQTAIVSQDGASLSQAITYCDNLIDMSGGDYEKAKTIADTINNGKQVGAGVIPLSTQTIAYRRGDALAFRVASRPGTGRWTLRFTLAKQATVDLAVFDVSGRRVSTVLHGVLGPGPHTADWDGSTATGMRAASGLYLVRLATPMGTETRKLLQLRW